MVPVAGDEHDALDAPARDLVEDGLPLLRRDVGERLEHRDRVKELTSDGHDFERRAAGGERVEQPLALGRAEHRAQRIRRRAVRRAVEAVVQQEEVDVSEPELRENARHAG